MNELSLHILDIVQNSIRAKATKIEVLITENIDNNQFIIEIADNGKGMNAEVIAEVYSPFFTTRTTRKVGLGISLLMHNAEQTGGSLVINSIENERTILKAIFTHNHWDRPILGDIAGTMTLLIAANPQIHFIYIHNVPANQFKLDTNEVKMEIEEVPINHPDILRAVKELINENLKNINATIN